MVFRRAIQGFYFRSVVKTQERDAIFELANVEYGIDRRSGVTDEILNVLIAGYVQVVVSEAMVTYDH